MSRQLEEQKRTRVVLGGSLGRKFGRVWYLVVNTPVEAMRMIGANCPEFNLEMRRLIDAGVNFGIRVDQRNRTEEELHLPAQREILIMPLLEGSKNGGVFQTILGVVLIVVGAIMYVYGGQAMMSAGVGLMASGAGMAIGGIVQMLSPMPKLGDPGTSSEGLKSYYFNGAANTDEQGAPVPVIYGRILTGSQPISASMEAT